MGPFTLIHFQNKPSVNLDVYILLAASVALLVSLYLTVKIDIYNLDPCISLLGSSLLSRLSGIVICGLFSLLYV